MKNILIILATLLSLSAHSQAGNSEGECATVMPANYKKFRDNLLKNNVKTLKHDLCVNKKFSIVFYVIADSNGSWGSITPAVLNNCIATLNSAFKRICVSFMNCSTVVIPHHPYNRWTRDSVENAVKPNWWTESTINLYLPDSIVGPASGYASMPGSPGKEIIVIEKPLSGSVAIHEMGHFFSLPHTFDEIGTQPVNPAPPTGVASKEFVRRDTSNCYNHGDGFCDTEADCYSVGFVKPPNPLPPCQRLFGAKDGWGDYYVPPVDNYMTYFKCGCRFTQEQYNQMALTALTQLKYLH